MNYILYIRTNASPNIFETGYSSRADGEAAIFRALEDGFFVADEYACTLGPGVRMQLRAADADQHEDTEDRNGITHYIIVTMLGQMIPLAYHSELQMKVALGSILRHGCFRQSFKGERDAVYVFVEPGTTYLALTAAAFEALVKGGEPAPSRKILLS